MRVWKESYSTSWDIVKDQGDQLPILTEHAPSWQWMRTLITRAAELEQDFFKIGLPCVLLPGTVVAVVMES